jgi:hypothetical protein
MKIYFVKEKYLNRLINLAKDKVQWLELCDINNPWLTNYFGHEKWYGDTDIEIPQNLELNIGGPESDVENSIKLYDLLRDKLTPVQACDPRLWAFLCHETCWNYMVNRWKPDAERDINSRYYLDGNDSRALSRNGIARLWWFAYLTYDENRTDPYELLKILLSDQNIQHNLLERNFGRNRMILHTILDFIRSHPKINKKDDYEKLGKIINRWGGVRLLDYLAKKDIMAYLETRYANA